MNILILQGPNFNLLGVRSAKAGERVTLDKINKKLRQYAHEVDLNIQLKFLQTHKADKAISFIQRNRNKSDGILMAPASWGKYEYSLLESLELSGLPCVQILLDDPYFSVKRSDSLFTTACIDTVISHPMTAFIIGLDTIRNHIT